MMFLHVYITTTKNIKNDSIVNTNKILRSDTAEVVLLWKDSLQLRFGDHLQCYSRKKTE